jgi:hypothetical protein
MRGAKRRIVKPTHPIVFKIDDRLGPQYSQSALLKENRVRQGELRAKMRCEMCGNPAEPTELGSLLCPVCRGRYREYRCVGCEQRVLFNVEHAGAMLEFDADICSLCHMRNRVRGLSEDDREAIRFAATVGVLTGVREVRDRHSWSIPEAVKAVHILRADA